MSEAWLIFVKLNVGVSALFFTTFIVSNFNEIFKARLYTLNLDTKLVANIAPLMEK